MDGHKRNIVFFSLIFFSFLNFACQKKDDDVVAAYKNDNSSASVQCDAESLVRNRFIVKYLDGRIETITAENDHVFESTFLDQHIHEIKRVEYDVKIKTQQNQSSPDSSVDTQATTDWGPGMIQADLVWNQGIKGAGVTVAVVDAAVDYKHVQIFPRLLKNTAEANGLPDVDDDGDGYIDNVYGWDFYKNAPTSDVLPPTGQDGPNVHGTHVAGIILADHTKGSVQGIAPEANLIPLNFMDQLGSGTISNAIPAIKYAVSHGAKIINASWGGGCSQSLKEVIEDIGNRGTLFVAAAGNDGADYDRISPVYYNYPAAFNIPTQITVAASTAVDLLAGFSNKSYKLIHLAAPGENIRSTVPTFAAASGAGYLDGTSMATPFVSGAAALLWSAKPNATVAQIRQALLSSVDVKSLKVSTRGRLNVSRALDEIRRIAP
jgi:subtilisin family serine protease